MKQNNRITASMLVEALAAKHAQDVFVPECKDGPTWNAEGMLRLDAWAMKRSWTRVVVWGYEVKVNRQDFLQDVKWTGYLEYCNEFYFVAAPGIIHPEELPQGIGLLVSSVNGKRLFTKRKAVWRDVQIPGSLYQYILMSRSRIVPASSGIRETDGRRVDVWREYLEERRERQSIGHRVSRALQKRIQSEIEDVARENRRLRHECEQLERVREVMVGLGFTTGNYPSWNIDKALRAMPHDILDRAVTTIKSLEDFVANVREMEREMIEKAEVKT